MILLVNDDGINAPGLRALYQALRATLPDPILVVAPKNQGSGQSQAITLNRGLQITSLHEQGFFGFLVDGTPTDCLKLALNVLCPRPPRLVVSGINDGPNVGRSLFYSGTVGAAMEAAIEYQAALAVSADHAAPDQSPPPEVLQDQARYTALLVKRLLNLRSLRGVVINVNLPASPAAAWGPMRVVEHGRSGFQETYTPRRVEGKLRWHLTGTRVERADETDTDAHVLRDGSPALSVLIPDLNPSPGSRPQELAQRLESLLQATDGSARQQVAEPTDV